MKHLFNACIFCNRMHQFLLLSVAWTLIPFVSLCRADQTSPAEDFPVDFTALSLEELKNVEIISVSKKPEKISLTPAAVFVITQEDIRRSGVTTIPDALRLAPGVQVARMDTHKWAVSVRGFNQLYANKLLVMIDGRSVYSPIFSGVLWDVQDTLLADIERIEIIRGPGSTLWGANAVNGVINIITKNAKDTRGGLVTAGNGTKEHAFGSVRYGDVLGEVAHYRIYAKYFQRDQLDDSVRDESAVINDDSEEVWDIDNMSADHWNGFRWGFRMDWEPAASDALCLQGEAYINGDDIEEYPIFGDSGAPDGKTSRNEGGHFLARWRHTLSETSETAFQMYYDRTKRDSPEAKYEVNTFDFDFQHHFVGGKRHEITWGLGYRFISDRIDDFSFNFYPVVFDPDSRDQSLFSAFVQDQMDIIEDRLSLTLGSKFEHNEFTGYEVQPAVRILWTPGERHSVWGAVSRAVRAPARSDHDGSIPVQIRRPSSEADYGEGTIIIDTESGSDDFDSEEVIAYEIGYRLCLTDRVWVDIAIFYNEYKGLKTMEEYLLGDSEETESSREADIALNEAFASHINQFYPENRMKGYTYGFEMIADWKAADWWRLNFIYSYLETQMCLTDDSTDIKSEPKIEGDSPRYQFSARSTMNITKKLELDLWLRYVDNLPARHIPSYTTLDTRLSWRPVKTLELSLIGQDLLDSHPEFSAHEVERSAYFKVTWKF